MNMRYCIWNNKGGVGKTFLTYCLASEYAIKNPNKYVVVIDMCPQANISEMMLGGNGLGEENLNKLYEKERTIASYIKSRYDRSRFGKLGNELSFFVQVSEYNRNMPSNLFLLPGDTDLDMCSALIEYLERAPEKNAWFKSRTLLLNLVETFEENNRDREVVFFIDSNPSFANYTQLGVLSSNRLIVPCTGDSASMRGLSNVFKLIYGVNENASQSESESVFYDFYQRTQDSGMNLPKLHCFVLNKSRSKNQNATKAYQAHINKIEMLINHLSDKYKDKFTRFPGNQEPLKPFNVKDGNNLALVVNHDGLPVSKLENKNYDVYGEASQVNSSQVQPFLSHIHEIVDIL